MRFLRTKAYNNPLSKQGYYIFHHSASMKLGLSHLPNQMSIEIS
jgi:hypothetical protein